MPFVSIFPNVYELNLGPVNIWLVEDVDGLTLIDTCYPGQEKAILAEVEKLGKKPGDIRNILLTHCHPDHAGSLAALKQITHAPAWMHKGDAEIVRGKRGLAMSKTSPGLVNAIMFRLFIKNVSPQYPPADIEHEIADGEVLPMAGGIKAIHTPGHSAGHMAFLIPGSGGLLVTGDACSNMMGLSYSIVYDDIEEGRRSLAKLAWQDCKVITFSHGKALKDTAIQKFKSKWAL